MVRNYVSTRYRYSRRVRDVIYEKTKYCSEYSQRYKSLDSFGIFLSPPSDNLDIILLFDLRSKLQ